MKPLRRAISCLPFLLAFSLCSSWGHAQEQSATPAPSPQTLAQEVKQLKEQVQVLQNRVDVLSSRTKPETKPDNAPFNTNYITRGVPILFGAFCALWAQNTKRNAVLWFFVGMIFNIIAVFVLLYKNWEPQ